ncbi:Carbohydrate sulfotransferase 8 [Tupaia chinensis]|uniref:Carbohydrate sulfotransferase n=1 Tax=Tupaia chinensis TaxID=246437 RepID=L8Y9A9_TUPCH|nr:Carbohydrate sulfotransferase 8 [Tupaia chinensis]
MRSQGQQAEKGSRGQQPAPGGGRQPAPGCRGGRAGRLVPSAAAAEGTVPDSSRLCSPCLIDYDFVGKFESMEDDANFFLSLIRAPRNLTFPRFKDRHSQEARTTTRIARQYFSQLSALQRQRTYDFYYMDYLMFNYSKPFADLY